MRTSRRSVVAAVSSAFLAGCLSGRRPDLRIRNRGERPRELSVLIKQGEERVLRKTFDLVENEQVVKKSLLESGEYAVTAKTADGVEASATFVVETPRTQMFHITVDGDEIRMGEISP